MSIFHNTIKQLVGKSSVHASAMRWGLSNTQLRNYLDGTTPRADMLLKIAEATGVSMDWLAGRAGASRAYLPPPPDGHPACTVRALTPAPPPPQKAAEYQLVEIAVWDGANRRIDYITFRAEYLRQKLRIPPTELTLVPVESDAPPLVAGGVCICHSSARHRDGLWALSNDGEPNYHRVIFAQKTASLYPPAADPNQIPPLTQLTKTEFQAASIGRVVWGGGTIL